LTYVDLKYETSIYIRNLNWWSY